MCVVVTCVNMYTALLLFNVNIVVRMKKVVNLENSIVVLIYSVVVLVLMCVFIISCTSAGRK